MQELLTTFFYEFISALETGDEQKVRQMAEKRFADKLVEMLPEIRKAGIKLDKTKGLNKITEDSSDFGILRKNLISDIKEDYVVEHMLIQGVSTNRELNDFNFDYELMKSKDEEGTRLYCHKYFTGHMHYYQHLAFQK